MYGCGVIGLPVLPPGCGLFPIGQDPDTQALVFASNCDAVGKNPNGTQIFAMRPDGTGLRQLTDSRGAVTEADGTIAVQSPTVFAYGPGGV